MLNFACNKKHKKAGNTTLMYAVMRGNTEMVECMVPYLIQDPEVIGALNKYDQHVFMLVAKYGNDTMMECLKQFLNPALVAAQDNITGNTCGMYIVEFGTEQMRKEIKKFLTPAILAIKNKKGHTIKNFLHPGIALQTNDYSYIDLMLNISQR